jgi:hypothetical protein
LEQAPNSGETLDFLPAWQFDHEKASSRKALSSGRNVHGAVLPGSKSESLLRPVTN